MAQDSGYFDQAHFVRDFRALTGLTPSRFQRQNETVTRHRGPEKGIEMIT